MKRVMFICSTNSIYSQIAEGFSKHLGVGTIRVTSAGLAVSKVAPDAIDTMNEAGVDISRQTSKALSAFNPENEVSRKPQTLVPSDSGPMVSLRWHKLVQKSGGF